MNLYSFFMQLLATTSFFAMRPFLGAFLVSALGRGLYEALITQGNSSLVGTIPPNIWILSETAIVIFLLLALLEMLAANHEDARPLYNDAAGVFQSGSALVVNYGLVDPVSVDFLQDFAQSLPAEWVVAVPIVAGHVAGSIGLQHVVVVDSESISQIAGWLGHGFAIIWAIAMAGITWLIGSIRYVLVETFENIDPNNSFGLRSLVHWIETGWTATTAALIIFIPAIAIGVFLCTVGMLALFRWYFRRQEHKAQVACDHCGQSVHLAAPSCYHCHTMRQPRAVGLFGQVTDRIETNPALQRTNLLARKRCPVCATLLKERAVQQACPTCATTTFADIAAVNTFLRDVDARVPKTLGYCFGFGLIPVVGIIPAIMYYQLSLVGSLRGYIPRSVGCFVRWGVRLINLILIGLQPVPILGAFTLPLMACISYNVYRGVMVQQSQSKLQRTFEPITAPAGTTPAAVAVAALCPDCGAGNPSGYRFCAKCGQKLVGE